MTPAEVRSLQWDDFDQRASELKDRVVDFLRSMGEADCLLAAAVLTSWDCRFEGENAGPAVWTALWSRLLQAVGGAVLGRPQNSWPNRLGRSSALCCWAKKIQVVTVSTFWTW